MKRDTASESHLTCQNRGSAESQAAADRWRLGTGEEQVLSEKTALLYKDSFSPPVRSRFTVVSASLQPAASIQPFFSVYKPKRAPWASFFQPHHKHGDATEKRVSPRSNKPAGQGHGCGDKNRAGSLNFGGSTEWKQVSGSHKDPL